MTKTELNEMFSQFKKQLFENTKKWQSKTNPNPTDHGFESAIPNDISNSSQSSNAIIQFIRFCLFFAAGLLVFANIKPYINIVTWFGSGLANTPIINWLSQFPLFGLLLSNGGVGLAFIAGFLLWGLLQGLQMLPKIILSNPEALLVLMAWVYQFKGIAHKSNDSPLLRKLKQRFNNLPLEWIERLQQTRAIAYVIDAILCFGYYPPINGGYDRLGIFLVSPSLSDVNWYNVIAALLTMFGIEILYEVSKTLKTALDIISQSKSKPDL